MKVAVLKFVPPWQGNGSFEKASPAHFAAGGLGGIHPALKHHRSQEEISRGLSHAAWSGATVDENGVPPWTRGDFRGVLAP